MTEDNWNGNLSNDEDDIPEEEFGYGGRDGILFVIDCSRSMFEDETKFPVVLECIEAVLLNRLIRSESDLIGVILYNTEFNPEDGNPKEISSTVIVPKNCSILMKFESQTAENVQRLMDMRKSETFNDFSTKYGHSDKCNLSEVFWLCSRMFMRCDYKLRATSIVLFTDNPMPHPQGSHELQQLLLRTNDLKQNEVNVTLIPMDPEFDGDQFYKQFLSMVLDEDASTFEMPIYEENISKLTKRIYRRDYRKKASSRVDFILSKDVKFAVAIYSMSRKTKYPAKVILDKATEDVIVRKRVYREITEDDESKRLLPGDQCKSIEYGGEKIVFTTAEHSRIKTIVPKGLKLLGFKPLSSVSTYSFISPCLFLFPDESQTIGGTKLFSALWQKCIEKERVVYALLVQKFKSIPTYVLLVPQENVFHNDEQVRNNGFRIIFLPYKDDIRDLDVYPKEVPESDEAGGQLFRKLIKKIKFKYNPSFFENPILQKIYCNIESIVYKTEDVEFEDSTLRHLEKQAENADGICGEIINKFGQVSLDTKKRPNAQRSESSSSAPATKQPKLNSSGNLQRDIIDALRSGNEDKLKVAELKEYLTLKGVSFTSKAKKMDLIEAVREFHVHDLE